ncbi:hypothetical protein G7K_4460-t1 [Saitoella complicata NRRL Y-17804]|uniref:Uncharacterized protein n=2 Tax=Saitoella complicata (strain BCRC 22490 / CBS 7301 / JCM 7358 / NBRC 10748 / NRRL Y-17804) TaxID=698492 RepID=A0A0E9NKV2_SAICN|nr:hypothetical protein G7K_4460-t1 [Saitoella complicata NRRL Y-17804]
MLASRICLRSTSRKGLLANVAQARAASTAPEASLEQLFRDISDAVDNPLVEAGSAEEQVFIPRRTHPITLFARSRIGRVDLPEDVMEKVNSIIKDSGVSGPEIRTAATNLYAELRESDAPDTTEFTDAQAAAYLAGLMPHVYAATYTVLTDLRKRMGSDWRPQSVLDLGVGPGTAGLVFRDVFEGIGRAEVHYSDMEDHDAATPQTEQLEDLAKLMVVEGNPKLHNHARTLHQAQMSGSKKSTTVIPRLPVSTMDWYDLVLAPHMILSSALDARERDDLVRDLWNRRVAPGGMMVVLERGTPQGFEAVARARQVILRTIENNDEKGYVVAPCPHDKECPMFAGGPDEHRREWCSFSQRLFSPPYLQKTKHARDNNEDAKYSYVVIRKGVERPGNPDPKVITVEDAGPEATGLWAEETLREAANHWPRIIVPPLKKHGHIIMDSCAPTGRLTRLIVPKSQGKQAYRDARKAMWGDLWALGTKNKGVARDLRLSRRSRLNQGKEEDVPKDEQESPEDEEELAAAMETLNKMDEEERTGKKSRDETSEKGGLRDLRGDSRDNKKRREWVRKTIAKEAKKAKKSGAQFGVNLGRRDATEEDK